MLDIGIMYSNPLVYKKMDKEGISFPTVDPVDF